MTAPGSASSAAREPYKYLDYYRFEDADIFFGREKETQITVGEILSARLVVLFSPSGSGKSSLINAGVRPELERLGYRTVYVRMGDEPTASIQREVRRRLDLATNDRNLSLPKFLAAVAEKSGAPLVLFLDQFEEFFLVFRNQPKLRAQFIEELARVKYDDDLPVYLVLSLREDYFAHLHELREAIPSIFQHNANVRLEPFAREQAQRAIERPLEVVGGQIDSALTERILEDLGEGNSHIEPIKLQIVCHELWQRKAADNSLGKDQYPAGGAEEILDTDLHKRLKAVPRSRHRRMVRVFEALKTPDGTKRFRSFEDLREVLGVEHDGRLQELLSKLAAVGLLRREQQAGTSWYEFRHDYLVRAVTEWLDQRERRHLGRRRFWLGLLPGAAFLVGYVLWCFGNVYVGFVPPQFDFQERQVRIERGRPFGLKVLPEIATTSLLESHLRDTAARNTVADRAARLGFLDQYEWAALADLLSSHTAGVFLLGLGEKERGLQALRDALTHEASTVRRAAANLLEIVGDNSRITIDALQQALADGRNDASGRARASAGTALALLGDNSDQTRTSLLRLLLREDHPDRAPFAQPARRTAARALLLLEGDLPRFSMARTHYLLVGGVVQQELQSGDPRKQKIAAQALALLRDGSYSTLLLLRQVLEDSRPGAQDAAARALARLGDNSPSTVLLLQQRLRDSAPRVQNAAAQALADLGDDSENTLILLRRLLRTSDKDLISSGASALARLGDDSKETLNLLRELLQHSDSWVRRHSAQALARLKDDEPETLQYLRRTLQDRPTGTIEFEKRTAADALALLEDNSEETLTLFRELLQDSDWSVQERVARALGYLKDDNPETLDFGSARSAAAAALARLDDDSKETLERLRHLLRDSEEGARQAAANALGVLLRARPTPELLEMLAARRSGYRTSAVQALARKDVLEEATLNQLEVLRRDQRPWVRLGAWEAQVTFQRRMRDATRADEQLTKAERLLEQGEPNRARFFYEDALTTLTGSIWVDHEKAGHAAMQIARCHARRGIEVLTARNLETAFERDPSLRETFETELRQEDSDWALLRGTRWIERLLGEG